KRHCQAFSQRAIISVLEVGGSVNSESRSRQGFSPSCVKKWVHRLRMLPAKCLVIMAMELSVSPGFQWMSLAPSCKKVLSPRFLYRQNSEVTCSRKSLSNSMAGTYWAGSNPRLTELMQYLCPVVCWGPSSKTWPKWLPQLAQRVSVRIMPWVESRIYSMAPSTALSKEGHPQLLSNLWTLSKSRALHALQW